MYYPPLRDTLVIGFGHKARHGKDSAARYLMGHIENKIVAKVAFSDALYSYCRVEHGMTKKDAPLLQRVGVSMRERDPETWVRAAYYSIVDKDADVIFITDVRFPNEVEFVKQLGGFVIRVDRVMETGKPYVAGDRDPRHISETALDDFTEWDAIIRNDEGQQGAFVSSVKETFRRLSAIKAAQHAY